MSIRRREQLTYEHDLMEYLQVREVEVLSHLSSCNSRFDVVDVVVPFVMMELWMGKL